MKMELDDAEIEVAHRIGKPGGRKPRQMVLRCAYALQSRIFDYAKNLKGQRNDQNGLFYQPTHPRALCCGKEGD